MRSRFIHFVRLFSPGSRDAELVHEVRDARPLPSSSREIDELYFFPAAKNNFYLIILCYLKLLM